MPTDEEIAWLAGLLEADGSFTSFDGLRKGGKSKTRYIGIKLYMSDLDIIQRAVIIMEGLCNSNFKIRESKQNQKVDPSRKLLYCIDINGQRAKIIMEYVLPYMGKRRTEAILKAIKLQSTLKSRKSIHSALTREREIFNGEPEHE